ncbi:MAG: DUF2225 domain-containing protein, partial [Candidatus Brocadiia bacterium]
MSRLCSLVAILVLLSLAVLGAEVHSISLKCPYCGKGFSGFAADADANVVGIDSDFCTYSLKGSTRSFVVQFCTNCCYCDLSDFILAGTPLSEKQKAAVAEVLPELARGQSFASPEAVPLDLKMKSALLCTQARGADLFDIARLAHTAAWCIRDKITFRAIRDGYFNPARAFDAFEAGKAALKLDSDAALSTALELLHLSVRLGLPASRDDLRAAIWKYATSSLGPQQQETLGAALDKFDADVQTESGFMLEAVVRFEDLLSRDVIKDGRDVLQYTYVVADLYRRTGKADMAKQWLTAANVPTQRPDILKMIPVLMAHIEKAGMPSSRKLPTVICPLCGAEVEIPPAREPDLLGGRDTDFGTYSLDPASYGTDVVTCGNCFFSRYRKVFADALSDEKKTRLRAALTDEKGRGESLLKTWYRYSLAARCLAALEASPDEVAMAWLSSAWAVRRGLCSPTLEVDFGSDVLYPDIASKKAAEVSDGTFDTYYLAALIAFRAGLVSERDSYTKKAGKMTAGDRSREVLVERAAQMYAAERGFLDAGFPYFEKASAGAKDADLYTFLLAECTRRRGDVKASRKLYEGCKGMPRVGEMA